MARASTSSLFCYVNLVGVPLTGSSGLCIEAIGRTPITKGTRLEPSTNWVGPSWCSG